MGRRTGLERGPYRLSGGYFYSSLQKQVTSHLPGGPLWRRSGGSSAGNPEGAGRPHGDSAVFPRFLIMSSGGLLARVAVISRVGHRGEGRSM